MTLVLPDEHKEENLKLSAEPYVDLFHIQLRSGGSFFIKEGDTVEWNGNTWESFPIGMSGEEISSDEKASRPKLKLVNPEGVFSRIILDGTLEKSTLYRYRVLRPDIDQNRPVYQLKMWTIWSITSVTKNYVEAELRNPMDGNNFYVPARQFLPPEFPTVTFR